MGVPKETEISCQCGTSSLERRYTDDVENDDGERTEEINEALVGNQEIGSIPHITCIQEDNQDETIAKNTGDADDDVKYVYYRIPR